MSDKSDKEARIRQQLDFLNKAAEAKLNSLDVAMQSKTTLEQQIKTLRVCQTTFKGTISLVLGERAKVKGEQFDILVPDTKDVISAIENHTPDTISNPDDLEDEIRELVRIFTYWFQKITTSSVGPCFSIENPLLGLANIPELKEDLNRFSQKYDFSTVQIAYRRVFDDLRETVFKKTVSDIKRAPNEFISYADCDGSCDVVDVTSLIPEGDPRSMGVQVDVESKIQELDQQIGEIERDILDSADYEKTGAVKATRAERRQQKTKSESATVQYKELKKNDQDVRIIKAHIRSSFADSLPGAKEDVVTEKKMQAKREEDELIRRREIVECAKREALNQQQELDRKRKIKREAIEARIKREPNNARIQNELGVFLLDNYSLFCDDLSIDYAIQEAFEKTYKLDSNCLTVLTEETALYIQQDINDKWLKTRFAAKASFYSIGIGLDILTGGNVIDWSEVRLRPDLNLNNIQVLTPEAARNLALIQGRKLKRIFLDGLHELTPGAAKELALSEVKEISLRGLCTLSTDTARELSMYHGSLHFGKIKMGREAYDLLWTMKGEFYGENNRVEVID